MVIIFLPLVLDKFGIVKRDPRLLTTAFLRSSAGSKQFRPGLFDFVPRSSERTVLLNYLLRNIIDNFQFVIAQQFVAINQQFDFAADLADGFNVFILMVPV
jgi:hypothetical protein